ncbi:hypothetical protein [Parapedobacter lycopersici]|uniref:hypothetical protein n=1 Tax=Parapedobacter lycopersici TaxID=1864939 RepID=UPI00214DB723|nr:hypothetical protein [Parapedobacter lycopersici]
MAGITSLSVYIINRVKYRRLVIGLASKALSRILNHSESYIASVESATNDNQYPAHEYAGLAKALNWTIKDLLPPDDAPVSDGTKVDKKVLSLSNPQDMRLVVEGLTEYGFFDKPKSLTDVAKHLYIDGKEEEKVLGWVLEQLLTERLLKGNGSEYTKA